MNDFDDEIQDIENLQVLKEISAMLRVSMGKSFNSNVLRIALDQEEDTIASVIIAYYDVNIDEEILGSAISKN